jgi:uncharacterized protein
MLFYTISVVLGAIILLAGLTVLLQDLQVFPAILKGKQSQELPSGVIQHKLPSALGVTLDIWEYGVVPDNNNVLLFLHGNGDTVDRAFSMQRFFAEIGFHTYSYDYRGIGNSTGRISESGIYLDTVAVVQFIATRHEILPNEIRVVGNSLGTGPTTYITNYFGINKFCLISPFYSIRQVVKERPWVGLLVPFLRYTFPNYQHLAEWQQQNLPNAELIIAHATNDTVIPISHSERLVALLNKNNTGKSMFEIQIYQDSDHKNIVTDVQPLLRDKMSKWIKF